MKKVRICLGRFQPFTLGHLKMATYKDLKGPDSEQEKSLREQPDLKEISNEKTIILMISTPKEKIDSRHPFSDEITKKEMNFIKENYSEIEDVIYVKSADICAWGELLKSKGYQATVWLTGSDEFERYKLMTLNVPKYEESNRDNRDFKDACSKSFYVECIERTDDDFISSISATKIRESLKNNDREYFKKAMPDNCEELFDEYRKEFLNAPEAPVKKTKKSKTL